VKSRVAPRLNSLRTHSQVLTIAAAAFVTTPR